MTTNNTKAVDEITSSRKASLVINGLTKQYPGVAVPAVDKLDMTVDEGHLVALLGPSGCGKTTTLRMVAGLMEPTAGQIVVNDKNVTQTPVHKRGMGMVFQSYALFPHMNVAENVAFGLQMRKVPKSQRHERVINALKMVQLDHLAERRIKALSGGQQQRIALARALVVEPTLLLLDEPLSNLDAKLRENMRTEIRQIQQRLGTTTLFVTHDQQEALDMADRVAVMNNGKIEQFGAPIDIYERPATKFVADFIGQANFVPSKVVKDAGTTSRGSRYLVESILFDPITCDGPSGVKTGAASIMVRPHRVRVVSSGQDSPPSNEHDVVRMSGTIANTAYIGNMVSYTVMCDRMLIKSEVLTDSSSIFHPGSEVVVEWDIADSYVLAEDPSSQDEKNVD